MLTAQKFKYSIFRSVSTSWALRERDVGRTKNGSWTQLKCCKFLSKYFINFWCTSFGISHLVWFDNYCWLSPVQSFLVSGPWGISGYNFLPQEFNRVQFISCSILSQIWQHLNISVERFQLTAESLNVVHIVQDIHSCHVLFCSVETNVRLVYLLTHQQVNVHTRALEAFKMAAPSH